MFLSEPFVSLIWAGEDKRFMEFKPKRVHLHMYVRKYRGEYRTVVVPTEEEEIRPYIVCLWLGQVRDIFPGG